ncbi:MAG TPA: hypothetical protein VHA14_03920 [Bryobacteraceae bacterium]|nr:hypothetical protein [Bryobacteraceae bacterium]
MRHQIKRELPAAGAQGQLHFIAFERAGAGDRSEVGVNGKRNPFAIHFAVGNLHGAHHAR